MYFNLHITVVYLFLWKPYFCFYVLSGRTEFDINDEEKGLANFNPSAITEIDRHGLFSFPHLI